MNTLRFTVISPTGEQWSIDNAQDNEQAWAAWTADSRLPLLAQRLLEDFVLFHDDPSLGQTLTRKYRGWTALVTGINLD